MEKVKNQLYIDINNLESELSSIEEKIRDKKILLEQEKEKERNKKSEKIVILLNDNFDSISDIKFEYKYNVSNVYFYFTLNNMGFQLETLSYNSFSVKTDSLIRNNGHICILSVNYDNLVRCIKQIEKYLPKIMNIK